MTTDERMAAVTSRCNRSIAVAELVVFRDMGGNIETLVCMSEETFNELTMLGVKINLRKVNESGEIVPTE